MEDRESLHRWLVDEGEQGNINYIIGTGLNHQTKPREEWSLLRMELRYTIQCLSSIEPRGWEFVATNGWKVRILFMEPVLNGFE